MKTNIITGVIAVIVAVVVSLVLVGGNNQPAQVGGNTRFPNSDITAKSFTGTGGSSSFATTTVGGMLNYSPYVIATTTTGAATTVTLSQADLMAGQYWRVNLNQAVDFTYQFPATSTLTSFLPNTGDSTEICFLNATSSGSQSLKFTAGTGIDIEGTTGTSTPSMSLGASNTACFRFFRSGNASGTVTAIGHIFGDRD